MPVPLLEPVFIQFCLTQEIFPEAHFGPRFNLEASDAWPEAAMGGLKLQVPKGNQEEATEPARLRSLFDPFILWFRWFEQSRRRSL